MDYEVTDDGDALQVAFKMGERQIAGMLLPFEKDGPTPDELLQLACLFGEVFKGCRAMPR